MSRLIPAVAVAALLAATGAIAQTSKPGDVAPNPTSPGAQTPSTQPVTPAPSTEPNATGNRLSPVDPAASAAPTMTEAEAKQWVDKAVYSADNSNVGSVAAIIRDTSGKVTELQADMGGFLGIGTTRVRLMPSQFKLNSDRVDINVPADQVKALPSVTK